jgi:hypothetical protein
MRNVFVVVLIALAMFSCDSLSDEQKQKMRNKNITNKFSDVIVLCDSNLWKGNVQIYTSSVFDSLFPGTPSRPKEYFYNLIQKQDFNSLNIYGKRNPNILEILETDTLETAYFNKISAAGVNNQHRYLLKGTKEQILEYLQEFGPSLLIGFERNQIDRFKDSFLKKAKGDIEDSLHNMFGISIKHEEGYGFAGAQENTIFIAKNDVVYVPGGGEYLQLDKKILVYKKPIGIEVVPTYSDLIKTSDSIIGAVINTGNKYDRGFGKISNNNFSQLFKDRIFIADNETKLIRCTWSSVGSAESLGGPMIATAFDNKRGYMVYVIAYLYGPMLKKADYIRMFQATIESIEIIE